MAEQTPSAPNTSLPAPPQAPAAPGQQDYTSAAGTANGSGNTVHMPPPPLAPVVIPQNNNPIPTAMTSPFTAGSAGGLVSPGPGGPRRAAPEPNKRALYVGGLDPRIGEEVLRQIFETAGHVQNVKIIPDKNVRIPLPIPPASPPGTGSCWIMSSGARTFTPLEAGCSATIATACSKLPAMPEFSNQTHRSEPPQTFLPGPRLPTLLNFLPLVLRSIRSCIRSRSFANTCFLVAQNKGYNYGFVEYDDPGAAESAMQNLNGRRVHQSVSHLARSTAGLSCIPSPGKNHPRRWTHGWFLSG